MSDKKYYVMCGSNCRYESMTKEQIMTAIEQAISTGEIGDVDTGFVTKIKEQNNGAGLSFWVGTQAEYNALDPKLNNCFYIITDDTTADDINAAIEALQARLATIENKVNNKMNVVLWQGRVDVGDIMDNVRHECIGIQNYNLFALELSDKTNKLTEARVLGYRDGEDNYFTVSGSLVKLGLEDTYTAQIFVSKDHFTCEELCKYSGRTDRTDELDLVKIIGIM